MWCLPYVLDLYFIDNEAAEKVASLFGTPSLHIGPGFSIAVCWATLHRWLHNRSAFPVKELADGCDPQTTPGGHFGSNEGLA